MDQGKSTAKKIHLECLGSLCGFIVCFQIDNKCHMKIQRDLHASKCQLYTNSNQNKWEVRMRNEKYILCILWIRKGNSHSGAAATPQKKAADPFFFFLKQLFAFYTKLHPLPLVLYLHSVFVYKSQVTFKRRTLAWGFFSQLRWKAPFFSWKGNYRCIC